MTGTKVLFVGGPRSGETVDLPLGLTTFEVREAVPVDLSYVADDEIPQPMEIRRGRYDVEQRSEIAYLVAFDYPRRAYWQGWGK